MPFCLSRSAAFSGGWCPMTSPTGRVSMAISGPGGTAVSGSGCMIRSVRRFGTKTDGINIRPPAAWIRNVSRRPRGLGNAAMMPGNRSRVANVICWWIPWACSWPWWSPSPLGKIGTARVSCSRASGEPAKSDARFGSMAAIGDNSSPGSRPGAGLSSSPSCVPRRRPDLRCCPDVGWWNAPSPG